MWRGDPGHKYKLTNNSPNYSDSFSPFKFANNCSLGEELHYKGTLIRFPLRKESSGLSDKLYTIPKLKELLKALNDDAAILLLFLRYVERIEVFTIDANSLVTKIFSVEIDKASECQRRQLKLAFLSEVGEYYSNPSSSLPHLQYEATITVYDVQVGTHSECQWIIMHWVGSKDKDVIKASSKVSSLPWIGLAVPLTLQCSSRLFCFLPLPDSKEVNPPLPVCVHGTFGLNKDRRHLKWITSDMKNDDGALWNKVLFSDILPSCYAECLNLLKEKCNPEIFYSFWPCVSVVNTTNWNIILHPLLSLLLRGQYFWSENGRWVGLDSSVCVVPQVNSSQFPKVVIDVLIRCGKTVVVLPENVWDAVKFIDGSSYPFTTIAPSVVRQSIRSISQSYSNLSKAEKFQLLHYCLDDRNYHDLHGLILLPTVVSTFVTFGTDQSAVKMHVCDTQFMNTKLLANNSSTLVNVEGDDVSLHHKLIEVANSRCTQLQILTPESVAVLLKQTSPFQNGWCYYGSAGGFYNENWLKIFWSWISADSLSFFVNIPLIPVCFGKDDNGFKVVELNYQESTQVFICNQSVSLFFCELVTAGEKLGCHMTSSEEFTFLDCSKLSGYVPQLSQSLLLNAASHTYLENIFFSQEEATALRQFLFYYSINFSLNVGQRLIALQLNIFTIVQSNALTSLKNATNVLKGNKSMVIVVLEPESIRKYLLFLPPIIKCERNIIENLQSMLPETCWVPTKLQLIINIILFAIENKQLNRAGIVKVTSMLLEPNEYYSLVITSDGDLLFNKLKVLKYLPTSQNSDLFSPCEVCDPMDHVVKELFDGQNVFPIVPFSDTHFPVLKQLGMKDCNTLSPSDITRVANVICSETDTQAKVKRANSLLAFLSSPTGNRLLNECYNNCPLGQTFCSLQWLPVITTPPKGYPICLRWKGSSGSQFVSAQSLHASSSPEEHKKLPNLIGSQMKILQYEGTLSVKLIASLNIPQSVPVDVMILQLLDLINHNTDIENNFLKESIKQLYSYLQHAAQQNQISQYWQQLSQSEVVQVSDNKFVLPSVVACSFDQQSETVGTLEPYWYILPHHLQQYRPLFQYIGVKEQITVSDALSVLETISSLPNDDNNYDEQISFIDKVLKWVCYSFTSEEIQDLRGSIFVPVKIDDNQVVLKQADQVAYLDENLQWLSDNKEALGDIIQDYFLVHPSISYNMCCTLQLNPLNTMIANSEEFGFEQAGQSEPLTTRLNRILREYKDTSVIQELLQNADDAEATEVAIFYDTREHDSSHLFFPGMANSYGPALLFYNNAEFSEEDFENIRKIAGETKMNKPLKIGKFGVGFCSVYHVTDVPSFVSGENLVVFDPTLQCLSKEIKSESSPGIKINFNKHFLLKKSKQLNPYAGICGFNPCKNFKGTLFRFPLRSTSSEISDNVYTESKVSSIIDNMKLNSSKLLMFLHNVKKLSFYLATDDSVTKNFEVVVTKQNINNCSLLTFATEVVPNEDKRENWLVTTDTKSLQTSFREKHFGTSSVSIKLLPGNTPNRYHVADIIGECFCFLPLNIETGLPVHVSSNFAVTTNRRGIWKADSAVTATKESNWNRMLMKTVVAEAYIKLLFYLQRMQQNGYIVDYIFHSLWPISIREINPWEILVKNIYTAILSNQYSLFYSEITNQWSKLHQCNFLSNEILAVRVGSNNTTIRPSLYHVATVLHLPVVDLPNSLWNEFHVYPNFLSQVIDEGKFIRYFYRDQTLSVVSTEAKTEIVTASLIAYASSTHDNVLPELLKSVKCIPCSPDGIVFKKPLQLLDPNSRIGTLFLPEDGMFPDTNFLQQNNILITLLDKIGLMQVLSWEMVIDRAKCVQNWYDRNSNDALDRLIVLIECIGKNSADSFMYLNKCISNELQKIPFLPVMQKPQSYPITWKGDSFAGHLLPGPDLKVSDSYQSVNAVYACGSQVAILDTHFLSSQSHRLLNYNVQKILGIKSKIGSTDVMNHFNELLMWFQECSNDEIDEEVLKSVNTIVMSIYHYINSKLSFNLSDHELQKHLIALKGKPCIWSTGKFLMPSCVAVNWKTDGPYLYNLPVILSKFSALVNNLGIKDNFPTSTYVKALSKMQNDYGNDSLSEECQAVIRLILPKLQYSTTIDKDQNVFLPDEKFVLRSTKKLKYNDAPWCDPDEEYVYCHECVERTTAIHLGVEPVRNALLQDLEITNDNDSEEFGQGEDLTQRLNNILRDYPRDITFLKEILQNADDAGATKLYITLDKRKHNHKKIISEEWKELQGPALLFWNNSTFTEEDLKGIQKLGLGSKTVDASTVGQYGIGFNVVYHFTDCPSFITDGKLCILDPYHYYIAHDKGKRPGKMYKDLEKLWQRFPDMKSSYLLRDLGEVPEEIKLKGSLFRLPLRQTIRHHKITKEAISVKTLEKELKEWMSQVSEALLFLHHISDVKFFIINDNESTNDLSWSEANLFYHIQSAKGEKRLVKQNGNAKLVSYPMTLITKEQQITEWVVQLGEGNVEDENFDWNEIKPPNVACSPHHGIAVPLNNENFTGKSFCYLPLPGTTRLPVHVHGHFILHSDRRGLWVSSSTRNIPTYSFGIRTVLPDLKAQWNDLMIKAISVSYSYLLIDLTVRVQSVVSKVALLQSYYSYFPLSHVCTTDPWPTLIKNLYTTLSSLNAPILAKLTESPILEFESSSANNDKKCFTVIWYKLLMPNSRNECFFCNEDSPIVIVLSSIGMNIVDAPMLIYEEFKMVDIQLSIISKISIVSYYFRFHSQILNGNSLPCAISSTQLIDINSLSVLLQYLMEYSTFSKEYENNKKFASLGLLVTADENLHSLSDGKGIISSHNWSLFPNSKHCFIHNGLRLWYPAHSSYLCKFNPTNTDHLRCILSIMQDNYPSSYNEKDSAWIKSILNCLISDPVFSVHCNEVLSKFRLLPATNNQLYSTKSKILPLTSISTSRIYLSSPGYDLENVKKLMMKLNVPLLQHELVGNVLDKIKLQLPSVWNPEDILKTLYLIREEVNSLKLTKQDLSVLFTVFKQISYSNKVNQMYIRQLPVFTTIRSQLAMLASATMVWIWNDKDVCTAGIDQWITHVPRNVLFLSPDAPWTCIRHEAKNLQMRWINQYDIYCRFIFPNFHFLGPNEQMAHLEFIKAEVFPNCNHDLMSVSIFTNNDVQHKAKSFVSAMKALRCISDDSGLLCTIDTFYDHNNQMFKLFCSESSFLPDKFRTKDWHDFLVYFGLKLVPTIEEFVCYCRNLPRLGNVSTIKCASLVLLKALLCSPWYCDDKYKDLKSKKCIKIVSNIPIAVVEEIPDLNCIKTQKMGELKVLDGQSTLYLTTLSGSSKVDNKYLLWTIASLINLPLESDAQILLDCGVVQSPSVKDVITNLKGLSSTTFANDTRFEKHDAGPMTAKSGLLPEVVVTMLKYIQTRLNEQRCSPEVVCKKYDLANTQFLPVTLLATNPKDYNLVKPTQVLYIKPTWQLYSKSVIDSSHIAQLYPYLHPLIEEAHEVINFLSYTGVRVSLDFSHIQLVLQMVQEKCQNSMIDENFRRVVVKATDELIELLRYCENKSDAAKYLKPLYLLSQKNTMVECSKLIVYDVVGFQQIPPPSGYAFLNPLKDGNKIRSKALSELLPKEIGLKSLKSMLDYDIIDSTQAEVIFPNVLIIEDILRSEQFKLGIQLLARNYNSDGIIPTSVTNILKTFQQNLTVKYLNYFKVQAKIIMGNKNILPANVIIDKWFLIQKITGQKWILSLKNTNKAYPHNELSNLAKELCSRLQLKSVSCFEVTSNDGFSELVSLVTSMLQSESISNIVEAIHSTVLDSHDSVLYMSPMKPVNPKLGDTIAKYWHHRLDQNVLNLFIPEEWVGYEAQNGTIVYAQVLHEIDQETVQVVNDIQKMMQRKYLITTGNDTFMEVHVLELYKFIQEICRKFSINQDAELDISDSPNISKQTQPMVDYEGIKAAVNAVLALPDEQQSRAIKRLYLQYHPDKNPDNPNATAQFQFLKEEIERTEGEYNKGNTHENDTSRTYSSQHSSPQWSDWFTQWNQTASSHSEFRSKDTGAPENRTFSRMNIPSPCIDLKEANIWIKQAEYDYSTLKVLVDISSTNETVSAAACFMCHEVAEKSLKAGMYAKCGVGQVSLNNHNLAIPARALVQLGCPIDDSDANSLERFYLDTRFPNRYHPSAVPGEKFNSATAKQALEAATRIFITMQKMICETS